LLVAAVPVFMTLFYLLPLASDFPSMTIRGLGPRNQMLSLLLQALRRFSIRRLDDLLSEQRPASRT
jgi:hypothetical protein